MSQLAVVHLVWGPLGPGALRGFLDSYRAQPAGVEHDLVVLLNGVEPGAGRRALLAELDGLEHRRLELDRPVLDLVAYRWAAESLGARRLCLLNSHARLLAPGWLEHLRRAQAAPGVELAGASGSWASLRSLASFDLGLPSAYRPVLPGRAVVRRVLGDLERERRPTAAPAPAGWVARAREHANRWRGQAPHLVGFPGHPDPHLRTNAVLGERERLRALLPASLSGKLGAHRFESGARGLTRRVTGSKRRVVVVDRDGDAWEAADWPRSATFWQHRQERLLVADNQTRAYEQGDAARRAVLAAYAWGPAGEAR